MCAGVLLVVMMIRREGRVFAQLLSVIISQVCVWGVFIDNVIRCVVGKFILQFMGKQRLYLVRKSTCLFERLKFFYFYTLTKLLLYLL